MSSSSSHPGSRAASCAECRRSKLKCDKNVPCGSCVRRQCAHVCPDGTLTATKGNKVLMAHAQRLEAEAKAMRQKIKELEATLANSRAQLSHPPESSSLLASKSPQDYGPDISVQPEYQDIEDVTADLGTFSIGSEGQTKYHVISAGSDYLSSLLISVGEEAPQPSTSFNTRFSGLPPEIVELVLAAPYGIRDCTYSKKILLPFLPSRVLAKRLIDLYSQYIGWIYHPVAQQEVITIIDTIYDEAGNRNVDFVHPHRLSVFFITMASGALFDDENQPMAERLQALACAAISIESILRNVTLHAVQALLMFTQFTSITQNSMDETMWLLFSACSRSAQAIGLQRDSAPWNLEAQETQRRRLLFFEIYAWDIAMSLSNARPCVFRIEEIDCCFPEDPGHIGPDGEKELSFHGWKYRFSVTCLAQTMRLCRAHRTPNYSTFLELDRRIRDFPLPKHLIAPTTNNGDGWSANAALAMQQYLGIAIPETNLLYVHRSHFAKALKDSPKDPLSHKFSPSVTAVYQSSRKIISGLRGLYAAHSEEVSRIWWFWACIFSSCCMLGGIVVESPSCSLAEDALSEIEQAVPFFKAGSERCRVKSTMTLLEKLLLRARMVHNAFRNGTELPPAYLDTNNTDLLGGVTGGKVCTLPQPKAFTRSAETRQVPSTLPSSSSDGNSPPSYDEGLFYLNGLLPDTNMGLGFLFPQQFPTVDLVTNPAPVQEEMPTDAVYLQYMQPEYMQPGDASSTLPTYSQQFQPQFQPQPLLGDQQFQQFPMGGNPNEIWDSFMQELTRDGYTIPNY